MGCRDGEDHCLHRALDARILRIVAGDEDRGTVHVYLSAGAGLLAEIEFSRIGPETSREDLRDANDTLS